MFRIQGEPARNPIKRGPFKAGRYLIVNDTGDIVRSNGVELIRVDMHFGQSTLEVTTPDGETTELLMSVDGYGFVPQMRAAILQGRARRNFDALAKLASPERRLIEAPKKQLTYAGQPSPE